jgi:hypothetical protein
VSGQGGGDERDVAFIKGLRTAREAVERQTDLPSLVFFERPSDFTKGVLSCLTAIDAQILEAVTRAVTPPADPEADQCEGGAL